MADKTPLKFILTSGEPTAVSEFNTGDTIPVSAGGTGATSAAGAASNLGLGTEDSPTFTGLTITGSMTLPAFTSITVDNITIDGNTISSSTDGIILEPDSRTGTISGTGGPVRWVIDSPAGQGAILSFRSDGNPRWAWRKDTAEPGSNAGGDLALRRYADNGAHIAGVGDPMSVERATGLVSMPYISQEASALKFRSGFPVAADGSYYVTLSYNETNRTVTITPTGATFDVYVAGTLYTFTGAQSIAHDATDGAHFVYFDNTGTLRKSTTAWDFHQDAMVCAIFWDATASRGIPMFELHHADRDTYAHQWRHNTDGTQISSYPSMGDYTLNEGDANSKVQWSLTSATIYDEDIKTVTEIMPAGGPYGILYRSGASGWRYYRTSTLPFTYSGSNLQYNWNNSGTWSLANLTEDYFVNMWVLLVPAIANANFTNNTDAKAGSPHVLILPGQSQYSTEAAAHAETFGGLSLSGIPFQEFAVCYQVTMKYHASIPPSPAFTNTARCAITRVVRVVGSRATINAAATTDHGANGGLLDDDHPQYVLADGTRNITGPQLVTVNSSSNALEIRQIGAGNALVIEDSANPDASPFVVDASGQVILGHTANISSYSLEVNTGSPFSGTRWVANANGPTMQLAKSRSATIGTYAVVQADDTLGVIRFSGDDGDSFSAAADILVSVDGTPGDGDMPGRMSFRTTPDGSATPLERMRISSGGLVTVGYTTATGPALSTTTAAKFHSRSNTYTDGATAASGTVTHGTINSFDNPAVDATNASVTYTSLSTVYIDGAPSAASANLTITNPYALYVNAGVSRFGGGVQEKSVSVTYNAGSTTTVDCRSGSYYYVTVATGATDWSFTNPAVSGDVSSFILELTNGGSQTQNWPSTVVWAANTPPSLTVSGKDLLMFTTRGAGAEDTWTGMVVVLDVRDT